MILIPNNALEYFIDIRITTGKIDSNGTLRSNISTAGKISSAGTIRANGSRWGSIDKYTGFEDLIPICF
jgi:hypothetical protein